MKNLLLLFSFMICGGLTTGAFAQVGPNCADLNIPVGQDDSATIAIASFVTNAAAAAPLTVTLKNPYGGILAHIEGADETTEIRIEACQYIGRELSLNVMGAGGPCWSKITFKGGNAPIIRGRSITVWCDDPLVAGGHIGGVPPRAIIPCGPDRPATLVGDWVDPRPCILGEDTAKVVYREYEAFGKDGTRGTGWDTITVFRLPQITALNTQCVEKDTTYCGALVGDHFGPFMVAENPATNECDTIYFLDPDGTAAEFDPKCGLAVAVKVDSFDKDCESLFKYTVLLKQTCYGMPSTACLIDPASNLTPVAEGYWECVFWHIDLDTFPPVVECEPDTMLVSTGPHDCVAHALLPPVTVTDSCNDIKQVKAMIEGLGTFHYDLVGGEWVSNDLVKIPLHEGLVKVRYEAVDACHNKGYDSCYIKIKDQTKPVAVCDKGVNVSLTGKKVWVEAETFDEGSWDNCGVNMLLVRRSDWAELTGCVDLCDSLALVTTGIHKDSLWTPILGTDKFKYPVEAHYQKTIDWLRADGQACAGLLFQSWRYGLMKHATTVCKGVDEQAFDDLARGVIGEEYFDQAKQIGGGWSDQVVFSCEDACGPVTVEILVMDYWCNWSRCWTDVWVEDKTPITIVKDVADVDITCSSYRAENYALGGDVASLEDIVLAADNGDLEAFAQLDEIFGGYKKAWIDPLGGYIDEFGDPIDCDITFVDDSCFCEDLPGVKRIKDPHLGWVEYDTVGRICDNAPNELHFNHGIVAVNCQENVQCEQDIWFSFDNCGQGVIYRKFRIWQGCPTTNAAHGARDTITKLQKIWVGNKCELDSGMFTMPADVTVESCDIQYDGDASGNVGGSAHPDSTGRPTYNFDDDCRLVGIGYYDKVFRVVGGDEACFKVIRTWCFADWCQVDKPVTDNWILDPDYEGIVFKHEQKIILRDTVPPEITITPLPGGNVVSAGGCAYDFSTTVDVGDACGVLSYRWALLDDDGAVVEEGSGELDLSLGSAFPVAADGLGTGAYTLRAVITDACQNEGVATYDFVISTEKKPGVICISSLVVELTPMDTDNDGIIDTGMAVIWASEYQNGSSTPACDDDSLAFFIEFLDGVGDDTLDPEDADSLAIGCEHLPNPFQVRMWVQSYPSGTSDFCDVFVIPQDNMNGCGDISTTNGFVRGDIQTELEESVEKVTVKAELSDGSSIDVTTRGSGAYTLAAALGLDVKVIPSKDTDHMNGISTADLVKIQKHIIGKQLLESPFREIAADVNDDRRISALDLLDIRKLILGKVEKLPNTESWAFVNAIDGQSIYEINDLRSGMQVDWTAIKKGDVNVTNDPSRSAGRSGKSLLIQTEDVRMETGNNYEVKLHAENFNGIEGYQFTLNFDPTTVVFRDINMNGNLQLSEENFGLQGVDQGFITTSWNAGEATDLKADDVLFTVTFEAIGTAKLSDVITINDRITAAEAYDEGGSALNVALAFGQETQIQDGFALYQNRPNPFNENTAIGFDLPEASSASLTIYDVAGKVIKVVEGDFVKGYNEIAITRKDLNVAGVLYYQLDSESFTATRKMVVID